ncbi:MAG: hypothetical protein COC01_04975 [Bacteroidetes bacterium]|nr:MAG: hypothetical protein COC01_04975 [Bacteroidota bacterium]
MSVILRKRKNSDGTTSLLLDIYNNGKRSYEFLKNSKLCKPVTALDRKNNRERLNLAKQICNKREQQIQSDEYDVSPEFRKGIDFVDFFESYLDKYNKKDKRVMNACFNKFKEFLKAESITERSSKKLSANIIIRFKEYLVENLNGSTPSTYFKKFKKVLRYGIREKIFSSEIPVLLGSRGNELKVQAIGGIKKDILSFDEIQILADTDLSNHEIKRAFFFSCYTGLRFCDIKILQWKNIQGKRLKITQQKTNVPVSVNLNNIALHLLGKIGNGDELIFTLPSHTACLKNLKNWCKKAKINKHITWHCARHSFGTGLVFHGGDVKNVSSLLGHTSLTYTGQYVRESDKLKEKAVENLPEINI